MVWTAALLIILGCTHTVYVCSTVADFDAQTNCDANRTSRREPWLGKWMSTDRHENWNQFAQAVGLPGFEAEPQPVVHETTKVGDRYHHVLTFPRQNTREKYEFRLGEEFVKSQHGTTSQVKYTEDGDKLVAQVFIHGKLRTIVSEVHGQEMIKTYQTENIVAKRWFRKEAEKSNATRHGFGL